MASPKPTIDTNSPAYKKLSGSAKRELRDIVAALTDSLTSNPLGGYEPHPKQVVFHAARDPVKAFIGGNRSGKTTAGIIDDIIQAVDEDAVPAHLRQFKKWEPPFFCRILAPDLTQTLEQVIYHKIRSWTPKDQLKGGSWSEAFNKQTRVLEFRNGSKFGFFTYEMDLDKFGGAAMHRIHYDEEPSGPNARAIRQECQMRLLDFDGDELFTMTPLFGLSWVHDEVWKNRGREGITAVQVDMDENPHLSEKAKKRLLADLTEEEMRARKRGEFVHFGGLFYGEFTHTKHIIPRPAPKEIKDWDVMVGIDPGSKTGVVWVAFDGDNRAVVFDELYPLGWVVPDIAAEIHKRNKEWGIEPAYVIDPAARIRTGPNQEQFTTEYARHNIFCDSGQNARGPGIMEVKRRLQKEALFVAESCRDLIWEFGRYRRDATATDEWQAVKQDDHLLDAMRYSIMARTWTLPDPQVRRRDNWNNVMHEPPFKGLPNTTNPPLGAMS